MGRFDDYFAMNQIRTALVPSWIRKRALEELRYILASKHRSLAQNRNMDEHNVNDLMSWGATPSQNVWSDITDLTTIAQQGGQEPRIYSRRRGEE